ncbi:hypothetical protein FWF48_03995 [Candidatus Saccharibacteria bacterium]|nr:hypothetical protein [Candidatus Saccharibacteria bacterium]
MNYDFWQKQGSKPLFPDIEWNKPEQKTKAGKLAIIGGNKLSFAVTAQNYTRANEFGVGEVRAVLPDSLRKNLPANPDIIFAPSNLTGSFNHEAVADLTATIMWADCTLLIGDLGKNAETAAVIEELATNNDKKQIITRDTVDLLLNVGSKLVEKDNTMLILTFTQLQKLFHHVYYPKVLTFNMQLTNLVEDLHKFTVTYPCTIGTLHQDSFIAAHGGQVVTTPLTDTKYSPMSLWSGEVATKAATYLIWNPGKPLEVLTTSIL